MDADPADLLALLELQKVESAIDRLTHRRDNLSEQVKLDDSREVLDTVDRACAEKDAEMIEVSRGRTRLETELDHFSQKIAHEEKRLFGGNITAAKELSSIQAEVEALKRRRTRLEDDLLEVMEAQEALEHEVAALRARQDRLREEVGELEVARDRALAEIGAQLEMEEKARGEQVPKIPQDLTDLYTELRRHKGGVGAAAYLDGTCQGCHLALLPLERERIKTAKGLVRCEQCGRILVVSP
jgi:predicted  nucleic acid-binding Zn-ribbon protein